MEHGQPAPLSRLSQRQSNATCDKETEITFATTAFMILYRILVAPHKTSK
jgi:hypothetical protein